MLIKSLFTYLDHDKRKVEVTTRGSLGGLEVVEDEDSMWWDSSMFKKDDKDYEDILACARDLIFDESLQSQDLSHLIVYWSSVVTLISFLDNK